jgi:carbonic anhydrase/acetyltransferase-like protein (isoleucine patch superfamily)
VIGVPGKVVKLTTEEQRAEIRRNAATYVELAGRYR